MRNFRTATTIYRLLLTHALTLWSASADAQSTDETAPEAASKAEDAGEGEPKSRFALSLKGFGGGLFSEHEQTGGGGGGVAGAFAVVPERFEIELGLALVVARDHDPTGVFEAIGKLLFESRGAWAPHVLLGPVLSLDFGHEVKNSGGVIVGTGVTYWFNARWGAVSEVAYRLLISRGPELEHILTGAVGATVRL